MLKSLVRTSFVQEMSLSNLIITGVDTLRDTLMEEDFPFLFKLDESDFSWL